jgi:site-specific DNA-methyltransferase (adenine-specific)
LENLLPLSQIKVGFRFREDLGNLSELAESIRTTSGLTFNFIVVEEIINEEAKEYHLRAGGRRLKAYELLSSGSPDAWGSHVPTQEEQDHYLSVPCTVLKNLIPMDRLKIEFIENKGRKDFTWQEECVFVSEVHKVGVATYGSPSGGRGKSGWSVRDTAEFLGIFPSQVIEYLQLAEGVLSSPKLVEVKQKSKALSKVKRQKQVDLANLLELGDYTLGDVRVRCADSREALLEVEDESIDLVITDPPWGVKFEEVTSDARTDAYVSYDDKFDAMENLEILTLCFQKLKPNSPLYMFYSSFPEKILEGVELLSTAGFNVERVPLIWYKKHVLSHMSGETRHMINYEPILYAWKGERPFLNRTSRNVFEHQVAYLNRIHSAEKSESLLAELIELHTEPGAMILDPWGGSCKLADVCRRLLRRCLVIEREPDLVKMATMRLEGVG